MQKALLPALGLAAALAGPAAAATITFDSQSRGPFGTLDEAGFTLTWVGFGDRQRVTTQAGGNRFLEDSRPRNGFGAEVIIARTDGGLFSLASLDIANLLGASGGSVSTTRGNRAVRLTGSNGSAARYRTTSSDFLTVTPTGFTDIATLSLNIVSNQRAGQALAVDNIVLSVPPGAPAIPEPMVLALFGAGLASLGLLRRWRRA